MKTWNNNFDNSRTKVNGKTIVVGEQDFDNSTILIKEEDGKLVSCPMLIDDLGDIYFLYDNTEIYLKWL